MDYLVANRARLGGKSRSTQKQMLKAGLINCFGPTNQVPLAKPLPSSFPLTIGDNYKLSIPNAEKHNSWFYSWNGHEVKLVGVYALFSRGSQVVCVQKGNELFAASLDWLIVTTQPMTASAQPKTCQCSTDVIWASGCQCGGC